MHNTENNPRQQGPLVTPARELGVTDVNVKSCEVILMAYRGRLVRSGFRGEERLEHRALSEVTSASARDELQNLIRQGNKSYFARVYRAALASYQIADAKVRELGLPETHPLRISVRILLGDALSALFRFPEAEAQFVTVARQRITDDSEPITLSELWIKLAKVYMGAGDSAYRAAANDVSVQASEIRTHYNRILGGGNAPDPGSPLYQNALAAMTNPIRRIIDAIDDEAKETSDLNAEIVATIFDCRSRFDQLDEGQNFFGHSRSYVPVLRFKHLQSVAQSFAKTAAQANREYLTYITKVQDETFTLRQLEQAVEINRSGVAVHAAAEDAAREEKRAAEAAVALAVERQRLARDYAEEFANKGYENAMLEEALAWAQAAAVSPDDEMRLRFNGLADLGIAERYKHRSDLIQELSWQRARRSYQLQKDRLRNQAKELKKSIAVTRQQLHAASARQSTAKLRRRAAEQRLRHSVENLESVRSRDFGVEFFSEAASLVRETASIYLQNAMLVALMMEQAYNFETGRDVELIRLDYGDLDGASEIFAADLLLRDVDAFTFDQIGNAETKSQPLMRRISLAQEYPLEYVRFRRDGRMRFTTVLGDFQRLHPGLYAGRIKSVIVRPIGLVGVNGAIGTFAVNGVSRTRTRENEVYEKMHAAETQFLSAFDTRRDRLFASTPEEQLDVFENVGLETDWQLEILQHNNRFDVSTLIDVEVFITFLGKFDSGLAAADVRAIPDREISEVSFSLFRELAVNGRKELARNERLDFAIERTRIPRQHDEPKVKALRLLAVGKDSNAVPLKVRFWSDAHGSAADSYASNANNIVVILGDEDGNGHRDTDLVSNWYIEIRASENAHLAAAAGGTEKLNFDGITDLFLVAGYEHLNAR